jgi:hypothetical protein
MMVENEATLPGLTENPFLLETDAVVSCEWTAERLENTATSSSWLRLRPISVRAAPL